jgi:hypothetical protein
MNLQSALDPLRLCLDRKALGTYMGNIRWLLSVFNRLPTEGYTQGGKFWVRERRDQELEGAKNTRL